GRGQRRGRRWLRLSWRGRGLPRGRMAGLGWRIRGARTPRPRAGGDSGRRRMAGASFSSQALVCRVDSRDPGGPMTRALPPLGALLVFVGCTAGKDDPSDDTSLDGDTDTDTDTDSDTDTDTDTDSDTDTDTDSDADTDTLPTG